MQHHRKGLTPMEKAFLGHMVRTGDPVYAAAQAGYSQPDIQAHQLMARPQLRAVIVERETDLLVSEGAPLAVQRHLELLRDPTTPKTVLMTAITVMYDRTGVGLKQLQSAENKEPHELTKDELEARLQALERLRSERAKPIVIEPSVFD